MVGAFDHGVGYLHSRTRVKINVDELAQLLGGRSLVNHHEHLPVGLHSNLIPVARITVFSLFLLVHLPPRHRDTKNCSREAIKPMRHHWLPRFEAIVAQVLRALRVLHVQFAVGHEPWSAEL